MFKNTVKLSRIVTPANESFVLSEKEKKKTVFCLLRCCAQKNEAFFLCCYFAAKPCIFIYTESATFVCLRFVGDSICEGGLGGCSLLLLTECNSKGTFKPMLCNTKALHVSKYLFFKKKSFCFSSSVKIETSAFDTTTVQKTTKERAL